MPPITPQIPWTPNTTTGINAPTNTPNPYWPNGNQSDFWWGGFSSGTTPQQQNLNAQGTTPTNRQGQTVGTWPQIGTPYGQAKVPNTTVPTPTTTPAPQPTPNGTTTPNVHKNVQTVGHMMDANGNMVNTSMDTMKAGQQLNQAQKTQQELLDQQVKATEAQENKSATMEAQYGKQKLQQAWVDKATEWQRLNAEHANNVLDAQSKIRDGNQQIAKIRQAIENNGGLPNSQGLDSYQTQLDKAYQNVSDIQAKYGNDSTSFLTNAQWVLNTYMGKIADINKQLQDTTTLEALKAQGLIAKGDKDPEQTLLDLKNALHDATLRAPAQADIVNKEQETWSKLYDADQTRNAEQAKLASEGKKYDQNATMNQKPDVNGLTYLRSADGNVMIDNQWNPIQANLSGFDPKVKTDTVVDWQGNTWIHWLDMSGNDKWVKSEAPKPKATQTTIDGLINQLNSGDQKQVDDALSQMKQMNQSDVDTIKGAVKDPKILENQADTQAKLKADKDYYDFQHNVMQQINSTDPTVRQGGIMSAVQSWMTMINDGIGKGANVFQRSAFQIAHSIDQRMSQGQSFTDAMQQELIDPTNAKPEVQQAHDAIIQNLQSSVEKEKLVFFLVQQCYK